MAVNMPSGADLVEKFFEALLDELAIPEARYEQAERSYESLGEWFHRDESTIRQFDPVVYVQGSFRLGTAIRPITEDEDYDVDSVCELRNLSKSHLSQYDLKQLLGREIKAYHGAHDMRNPMREGRRCWVLDYADGAQFHMDLLPAVPNASEQRLLLEQARLDTRWAGTAVAITDRDAATYRLRTNLWPRSNPKGYSAWFVSRMVVSLNRRKQLLVDSLRRRGVTASVEDMPEYRVRTPLQSAVMLLKRHRDSVFAHDPDLKPISVIISTLAAHAYGQEDTITGALASILADMDKYILSDGVNWQIPNPTDPYENFADRWQKEPKKADLFFNWLKQARQEFGRVAQLTTLKAMNDAISPRLGTSLSDRLAKKLSSPGGGGLLRSSSVASAAASVPTFGNSPRVPTTPKGFA